MKKVVTCSLFLCVIFLFYPPSSSLAKKTKEQEPSTETIFKYLLIKNEVLKYQLEKRIDLFNQLYQTVNKK